MMDDLMQELKTLVEKEIKKIIQKGDITPIELESATKAVCLIKMIDGEDNEGEDYGYSSEYGMPYDMMYRTGYYDRPMQSYRRGRSSRTGRYMSRDTGMSGHSINDRAIAALESMVDTAKTDYERQQIISMIDKLRD